MNTYITLLRGINVGGHKKILMADLRVLIEKLKFKNVKTYIQSGNIIFQTSDDNISEIENAIKNQITKQYDFEIPVLVKTQKELKSIFDNCPFQDEKKVDSYFMLLYSIPNEELVNEINQIKSPYEEFLVTKNCVYSYSSNGYGKTKFGNNFFERKLKVTATARNYKTMVKLLEMAS